MTQNVRDQAHDSAIPKAIVSYAEKLRRIYQLRLARIRDQQDIGRRGIPEDFDAGTVGAADRPYRRIYPVRQFHGVGRRPLVISGPVRRNVASQGAYHLRVRGAGQVNRNQ